ncbi:competence protein ComEA [Acetoanaerobium pronyense]|uniref:Competence protein ComEA n=1 Tax=Acetoanaerobium pronyense TaxID=1482736 RepID=A0ABS4KGU1_9FIRM|nr:helix-hairpin-helix domain-containing protein [Acetoanaerobium pronyense]MBP2026975.1 competence protein ComEA [Acetoanaerobium pronyense]
MKNKKEKYIVAVIVLFALLLGVYRIYPREKEYIIDKDKNDEIENIEEITFEDTSENTEVTVFISGEINSPKVITMEKGKRLIDAVEECGGLTEDADLNKINLSLVLEEEGHYIIPKIGDVLEATNTNFSEAGSIKSLKININTATKDELKSLPGIGDVLADRIIEKRDSIGRFKNIEDIKGVSGIGDKKYDDIKDKISTE